MEKYLITNSQCVICPQSCFNSTDITNISYDFSKLIPNTSINYDNKREFVVEQDYNNTIIKLVYFEFKLDELNITINEDTACPKKLSLICIFGKKQSLCNAIETDMTIRLKRDAYDTTKTTYKFDNNVLTITIPYKNVNNK